jgi:ribose 5-phosphate isomerase B
VHIAIGSDHAGYSLKREILDLLDTLGHTSKDFGVYDTAPSDYPDVAEVVARAVASGSFDRGILLCGSGIGMDIAANKVHGIRAALCHDTFCAHSSREHNDANILCMGERVVGKGLARDVATVWLAAEFCGLERHQRRIDKITALDAQR